MTLFLAMLVLSGAAGVLQSMLPSIGLLGGVKIPLLVSVVVYYSLNHDTFTGLMAALLAGLFQDVLSPLMPLGYSVFCFSCIALGAARCRKIVSPRIPVVVVLFGAAGAFVSSLILWILLEREDQTSWGIWHGLWKTAGAGILGGIATPLAFIPARMADRLLGNEEDEMEEDIDEVA